ncbi:MAG: hypothetical protein HKL82_08130 [Acidimicrobiaceae bacterium]|nr:hypothetical protein [Acidimicrobiaceae bacterium]
MSPSSKSKSSDKAQQSGGRLGRKRAAPASSSRKTGRYTPPKPKSSKKSNPKMLYAIFGPIAVGGLLILANFLILLPGGASNWYLFLGLALISVGFFVATNYR